VSAARILCLPWTSDVVILIDNAHGNPQDLVEQASTQDFRPIAPHYPGIRSTVPKDYLVGMMNAVGPVLKKHFGPFSMARVQEAFFSLATTPPQELNAMQCLPHIDGTDDRKVALLHYLCGPEQGGTGFYRHKSTGLTTITPQNFQHYREAVYGDLETIGPIPLAYPAGTSERYERILFVDSMPDRLIIYRGNNLHAVCPGEHANFSRDPRVGRLTVNTFLRLEE